MQEDDIRNAAGLFSESQACRGHSHSRTFAPAILVAWYILQAASQPAPSHSPGLTSNVTSQGAFSDPSGTSSDPPLLRSSLLSPFIYQLHSTHHSRNTSESILAYSLAVCFLRWTVSLQPSQAVSSVPPLGSASDTEGTTCVCEKMGEAQRLCVPSKKRCLLFKASTKPSEKRWLLI